MAIAAVSLSINPRCGLLFGEALQQNGINFEPIAATIHFAPLRISAALESSRERKLSIVPGEAH
jgi:hypothetical protein